MTTQAEATEAMYQRFKDEWKNDADAELTPYAFDNKTIDPPAGSDGRGAPWARFSVRHTDAHQETLGKAGNRKFARTGRAFVQLFVPPGSGRAVTDDYMEVARSMFEGRVISGTTIRFNDVIVRELGDVEDGRWWASTCEAVFEYDQTK